MFPIPNKNIRLMLHINNRFFLIKIVLDFLQLYAWTSEGEARIVGKNHDEHLNLVLSKISDNMPNVSIYMHWSSTIFFIMLYIILASQSHLLGSKVF